MSQRPVRQPPGKKATAKNNYIKIWISEENLHLLKKEKLLPKHPLISVQIKSIYNVLLGKKEDSQKKKTWSKLSLRKLGSEWYPMIDTKQDLSVIDISLKEGLSELRVQFSVISQISVW